MVSYILIFKFFKEETGRWKRFWTEWQGTFSEFNVLLNFSWICVDDQVQRYQNLQITRLYVHHINALSTAVSEICLYK